MRKMLVVTNDFPPAIGGIAQVLSSICKVLPTDRVCVLAQEAEGDAQYDAAQDYTIYRTPYRKQHRLRDLFTYMKKTIEHARKENCDGLYFDKAYPLGMAGFWGKCRGLPYIVHTYGNDVLMPHKPVAKWIQTQVLKRAQHVITISNFTKEHLIKIGIREERIVIMYPKADFSRFITPCDTEDLKRQHQLTGKKIILSVGRLVERKGFDKVIQALPHVLRQCPNVVYLVVGNGPDLKRLQQSASELQVSAHVRFITDCSDEQIPAFFHACHIFTMPSRYIVEQGDVEGFGIVYLEANACKKPALGGRSGGVPDAVIEGETGLLCDPESVSDITQKLKTLLGDEALCKDLGEQGYQRVMNDFQIQGYASEFETSIFED
jgi:phosphatidylinositol alpha-1,6-mannosyltransferase